MKKVLTIIGLALHLIYYVFAILSLGDYEYIGYGVGKAFAFWIYAMLISLIVIGVYLADGIVSFVKRRRTFELLKLILIALSFPVCVCVGCSAGVANSIIWNIYFAIVFVMQITSLFVKE